MSKSKRTINGRTVVISGAASGIGRALAQRLSAHGCAVAITDVDENGLKETEASLKGATLVRVLDVRDADAQRDFAAAVREWAPSPIAAVFNNAGVAVAQSIITGVPEDDSWLWDINFHGVVNGTRAFLPILVEQDEGAIVNTSSVYGLMAVPNQSAYSAAKFAVRGFTDSLRHELRGSGVTAISVHPGGVKTNIVHNARFGDDELDREKMAQDFAAVAMSTPDKAAKKIHRGVEKGKGRILIGPDAYLLDAVARVAPTHGYGVLATFGNALGKLSGKVSSARNKAG
jgi:NADP-dependent 3-hydroxy acid dehydrogenase YdfG